MLSSRQTLIDRSFVSCYPFHPSTSLLACMFGLLHGIPADPVLLVLLAGS